MLSAVTGGGASVELQNRAALLRALAAGAPTVALSVPLPASPVSFDAVADDSCIKEPKSGTMLGGLIDGAKAKFNSLAYTRPAPCTGAEAVKLLQEILSKGSLTIAGSHGFYLLYELLTGSLQISILSGSASFQPISDHRPVSRNSFSSRSFAISSARGAAEASPSFLLARTLLRMLPAGDSCTKGLPISVLRTLAANPAVVGKLPKYEPPADGGRLKDRVAVAFSSDVMDHGIRTHVSSRAITFYLLLTSPRLTTHYSLLTSFYSLPTYLLRASMHRLLDYPTTRDSLLTSHFPLLTTHHLLPTAYYLLPTACYLLPGTLPTTHYLLVTTYTYYSPPATCYLIPLTHRPLPTTHYSLPTTYSYYSPPAAYYTLHTTCYPLPGTHRLLPTTHHLLPATCFLLPTTCYLFPTTYYLLPTTYYLLPTTGTLPTTYYCSLLLTTYYLLQDETNLQRSNSRSK